MQKTSPRALARLLLVAAAPMVLLTACADEFGVSPMPQGYKYSQQYTVRGTPAEVHVYPGEFKQAAPVLPAPVMDTTMAAPLVPVAPVPATVAPSAGASTTTTTTTTATTVTAPAAMAAAGPQWQHAADDLLDRTEKNFGRLKEPVAVRPPAHDEPGENAFAQALLLALDSHHYKMGTDPLKTPYSFDYSIGAPEASGHSVVSLMTDTAGSLMVHKESGSYALGGGTGALSAPATGGTMPPLTDNGPASAHDSTHDVAIIPSDKEVSAKPVTAAAPQAPAPMPASASSDAPPPPMTATSSPSYNKVGPDDQPTYIYDANTSGKNPGKTAYEQQAGAGKIVPADEGDAPSGNGGGDVH